MINTNDYFLLKERSKENDHLFFAILDGKDINSANDYIEQIQTKFKFPTSCIDNWDGYLDWIRDLDWLEKEEYILVIINFSQFLRDDIDLKKEIISDFEDTILPFWEEEVERVVVDGKPKPFNVYLVN
jgi:hypothetical protein